MFPACRGVTSPDDRDLRTSRQALVRYAAAWVLAGVLAAALVVLALRSVEGERQPRRVVDPLAAVVESGCVLEDPRGKSADVSRPPVSGPPSRPLAEGVYSRPQPRARLVGALRRGVVIIQYDRRLPARDVALLHRAFATSGPRRALVPDTSGMTFTVAATAWGRLLGCSLLDGEVIEGLKRFADRYDGGGPDAPGG
jgi:hypothetical protein